MCLPNVSDPPLSAASLRPLARAFYRRSAEEVARDLLGRYLVRRLEGERLVVKLVETEAYLGAPDRASHAWNGRRTERTESLYLPGGFAYVYFIYGIHHCLNAVTGEADVGSAVLLRAAEPMEGTDTLRRLRGWQDREVRPGDLAGGPGKLCQALAIDRALDGVPLGAFEGREEAVELSITEGDPAATAEIVTGPRVGVDYAGEAAGWPLRFALRGNRHVSRPRVDR